MILQRVARLAGLSNTTSFFVGSWGSEADEVPFYRRRAEKDNYHARDFSYLGQAYFFLFQCQVILYHLN
ncbi:hypothetical protein EBR25_03030 [bacterium]|nr:hypothetical protein [bacterium]